MKKNLVLFMLVGHNTIEAQKSKSKALAHWRFEQVRPLDGTFSAVL
jgi:hypothetical protein